MYGSDTSALRRFSGSKPSEHSHSRVSVCELSWAISEFLDRRFKGLAEAELMPVGKEFILISPEQLAYFIKTLLKILDGGAYLYIGFFHTSSDFVIELKPSTLIKLELSEQAALCSAASAAGFAIEITESKISLSTELESARSRVKAVYEKPALDLKLLFESVFFE